MKKVEKDSVKRRIMAFLTRSEMEYLEKLGMDSLFSTGSKLSKVDIISALVEVAVKLEVSADGVTGKKELVQKILDKFSIHMDRRTYPRLKKNLVVTFRKADSLEEREEAVTGDISAGGFRIDVAYLHNPPSIHQIIEIALKDPNEEKEPMRAIGRIAWIKGKENDADLEIGVMITHIRKEDRERFTAYLVGEEVGAR